ncbi:hypothetical protein H311_02028, partial [Anncaliia algerae PRA109]
MENKMERRKKNEKLLNKGSKITNYYLNFIKTGLLPSFQDSLNSKKRMETKVENDIAKKMERLNAIEQLEFEFSPENTSIKLRRKIPYLENVLIQDVNEWINQMQDLIEETKWETNTAVIIIKSLIRIPYAKSVDAYSTADQVFQDLQKQYYPEENLYFYRNELNKLRLKYFEWIDDYIDAIKTNLTKLGCCMRLTKKQVEEKFDEYFLNGMAFEARIEMQKHKISKVCDMIISIKETESLIRQHLNSKTIHNEYNENFPINKVQKKKNKDYKVVYKRWCVNCKSNTHDTKFCYKSKSKAESKFEIKNIEDQKKDFKKDTKKYIVKSNSTSGLIEVPIQIVNNDQNFSNYDMIFDTGSEYNYVNRSIVNKENLQIVSVPQFKLISAVGETIIKEKTE